MDFRTLRLRCEAQLEALELPVPFSAHAFSSVLAAKRGRPILLRPITSAAGPWGLWVALPTRDLVFFEQATTPLHQQHIIVHELCHLVCDHRAPTIASDEVRQLLFPDLQVETIERVLRRVGYKAEEEQEAEMLASLVLERVSYRSTQPPISGDPLAAEIRGRLIELIPPEEGKRP